VVHASSDAFRDVHRGNMAAGWDYADVLRGEREFVVFWMTKSRDHAPGSLIASEAELPVAHLSGAP